MRVSTGYVYMARFDELELPNFVHDAAQTSAETVPAPHLRHLSVIAATAPAGLSFILQLLRRAEAKVDDVEFRRDIKRLDRLAKAHQQAGERWQTHLAVAHPVWAKQLAEADERFLARYAEASIPLQLAIAAAYEFVVTCHLAVYAETYAEAESTHLQFQQTGLGELLRWQARAVGSHRTLAHRLAGALKLGYSLRMRAYVMVLRELWGHVRRTSRSQPWRGRIWRLCPDDRTRSLLRALIHYTRPSFRRTAEHCSAALAH